MALERLLVRHPYLATVPDDAPEGMDSPLPPPPPIDWTRAGNVFPINGDADQADEVEEREEERSEDGEQEPQGRPREETTWEDWALCMGAEIMAEVRSEIWTRLHYTCSAVSTSIEVREVLTTQGIAHNKAMSKVCMCGTFYGQANL